MKLVDLPLPIAGVDEVGRGPLAGDVLAAAVILQRKSEIPGLDDSKLMTPKKRKALYSLIKNNALCWSIGRASVAEIDKKNILKASLLAMDRAVQGLAMIPGYVLVDGNKLPNWDYPSQAIIRGDKKIPEISAASIIAKVIRDQELEELDAIYPGYGFARNKGYPTKEHLSALKKLGPTDAHRKSFEPVKRLLGLRSG